jgi:hypothetical protein
MPSSSTAAMSKGISFHGCRWIRRSRNCCFPVSSQLQQQYHPNQRSFSVANNSTSRHIDFTIRSTSILPMTVYDIGGKRCARRSVRSVASNDGRFFSTSSNNNNNNDNNSNNNNGEDVVLPPRDVMMYDVCIVGGGPAGLSAAIKIKQLCQQYSNQKQISVCVIDKGRYGIINEYIYIYIYKSRHYSVIACYFLKLIATLGLSHSLFVFF